MKQPRQRRDGTAALARQVTELGLAVPQVVAHRVIRMALAGPTLSSRDRREFNAMVAEKQAAFTQGWLAMGAQASMAGPGMAAALLGGASLASAWRAAACDLLGRGLAPVHRKAVANARRLARTPLR